MLKQVAFELIRPNPWRYLDLWPLRTERLDEIEKMLRTSPSGYWENILAREMPDGTVQLAHGHHRVEVLGKHLGYKTIGLIIKDLDDNAMLRAMVDENLKELHDPSVHYHACKAAIDFITKAILAACKEAGVTAEHYTPHARHKDNPEYNNNTQLKKKSYRAVLALLNQNRTIIPDQHTFDRLVGKLLKGGALGWPMVARYYGGVVEGDKVVQEGTIPSYLIKQATPLAKEIDEDKFVAKVLQTMPTISAARRFVQVVNRFKIPKEKQPKAATEFLAKTKDSEQAKAIVQAKETMGIKDPVLDNVYIHTEKLISTLGTTGTKGIKVSKSIEETGKEPGKALGSQLYLAYNKLLEIMEPLKPYMVKPVKAATNEQIKQKTRKGLSIVK